MTQNSEKSTLVKQSKFAELIFPFLLTKIFIYTCLQIFLGFVLCFDVVVWGFLREAVGSNSLST